jgi:hypothetical protein
VRNGFSFYLFHPNLTPICVLAFDGYVGFGSSGIVFLIQVAGKAALARISCLWFHCRAYQRISGEKLGSESS